MPTELCRGHWTWKVSEFLLLLWLVRSDPRSDDRQVKRAPTKQRRLRQQERVQPAQGSILR